MRVCAAIVRHHTILMVRHEHDGHAYWTLPGGGVEPGESPEEAIVREVQEEVGLVGRVGARLYEDATSDGGLEVCFTVDVDLQAEPRLGSDPELPIDAQVLTAVAWLPLAELAQDVQVARVISRGLPLVVDL